MRKTLMGMAAILAVLFLAAGPGLARNGGGYGSGYHGGSGGGAMGGGPGGTVGGSGGGTGTPYICEYGEDATVSGVVFSVNLWGAGMVVVVDAETSVTVYGLGPWWYWDAQGVALPSAGDNVTVSVKHVVINGAERDVAMSLTNNTTGESISLRDAETCYPYWSAGR